jgi:dolichyl-diphosphooligosaccharide--protein glycosyltransferase
VITDIEMIYGKLGAIATWIGEDVNSYQMVQEYGGYLSIRPLKKLMETTLSGLHLFDCSGMEHLRLIYESNGTLLSDLNTSRIKIYEHVSGAKICGTAPMDQPVGVLLNMTSNQGRHFTYFNYDAPEDGRYEIVVPYSTEARYATHATDPYQLIVGDDIRHIEISDEDVLKGRVIEVNF